MPSIKSISVDDSTFSTHSLHCPKCGVKVVVEQWPDGIYRGRHKADDDGIYRACGARLVVDLVEEES